MDPDFIIGGAPKCATTALFDYLAQHDKVFASDPKEPHYFASAALGRPIMQGDYTREQYLALFKGKRPGQVSGEGSTHYLHHAHAVAPLIARTNPQVRLIFCLRNPVDRAYSHYLYRYATAGPYTVGGMGRSREFLAFLRDPEIFAMGDYAHNLAIFFAHFPPEQIALVFFEDVARDLPSCLAQLCRHVGIEEGFAFDLARRSNETAYARRPWLMPAADGLTTLIYPALSVAARRRLMAMRHSLFFALDAAKPRLSAKDRIAATDLYRPSIHRLEEMTGRDLSNWLEVRP